MTSSDRPSTRPARVTAARGFTLLEAAAVLVIIGIISAASALYFTRVMAGQADLAGQPTLGAAQAQARRVAALNHYTWPFAGAQPSPGAALAAAMQAQTPAAAAGGVDYVAGASTSPKQVSVAWGDDTHVAFAVLTAPGRCLTMVDTLTDGSVWARDTGVGDGGCDAARTVAMAHDCPGAITGTSGAPTPVRLADGCPSASQSPTP